MKFADLEYYVCAPLLLPCCKCLVSIPRSFVDCFCCISQFCWCFRVCLLRIVAVSVLEFPVFWSLSQCCVWCVAASRSVSLVSLSLLLHLNLYHLTTLLISRASSIYVEWVCVSVCKDESIPLIIIYNMMIVLTLSVPRCRLPPFARRALSSWTRRRNWSSNPASSSSRSVARSDSIPSSSSSSSSSVHCSCAMDPLLRGRLRRERGREREREEGGRKGFSLQSLTTRACTTFFFTNCHCDMICAVAFAKPRLSVHSHTGTEWHHQASAASRQHATVQQVSRFLHLKSYPADKRKQTTRNHVLSQ